MWRIYFGYTHELGFERRRRGWALTYEIFFWEEGLDLLLLGIRQIICHILPSTVSIDTPCILMNSISNLFAHIVLHLPGSLGR